jgi:RES domain-containing protein
LSDGEKRLVRELGAVHALPAGYRALWRISEYSDLRGIGGELGSARWHTQEDGKRIVYLAADAATALIETLVNLKGGPEYMPRFGQLLRIHAAVETSCERVADLPDGWRDDFASTQAIGDEWLSSKRSALLRVPSAPAPESWNYLLNPLHPDGAGVRVENSQRIGYDRRLFHVGTPQR